MAFTVTPASGAAPYVFEASFDEIDSFSTGAFSLEVYSVTGTGSCPPPPITGTNVVVIANALLTDGVYTSGSTSVPGGECSNYNLVIRNNVTNLIVDSSSVTVSNV